MDAKAAVVIAKKHLLDLFNEEGIEDLGLEAVEYDEGQKLWKVTLGFSRPWDRPKNAFAALQPSAFNRRTYKVVLVHNDTGDVVAVRSRESRTG